MGSTILATLPIGLGIALNPIAVVVGLLVLRSPHARRNGLAYAGGWVLGLVVLLVLATRLVQWQVGARRHELIDLPNIVWIAIGGGLLVAAAWRILRGRPLPGEEPPPPRWLGMVDRAGTGQALGIGVFLATVSLRNLALLAAAASVIGYAEPGLVERAVIIAAFVAVSSIGIIAPVMMRLLGGQGVDATLQRWSNWLNAHMGTIAALVMAVLGLYLLGKGVSGLR